MNRKLLAMLLAAILATAPLCGCKDSDDNIADTDVIAEEKGLEEIEIEEIETEEADVSEEGADKAEEEDTAEEAADVTEDAEEPAAETDTADSEKAPEDKISAYVDTNISIPDIEIGSISSEDVKLYFGVDVTDIDLDNITPKDLITIGQLIERVSSNFTLEDVAKLKEMSPVEIIEFAKTRGEFIITLAKLLEQAGIGVVMDAVSGEITLDSAILFDYDSSEISDGGKAVIATLSTVYAALVSDERFDGFIDSVVIEGHTDASGSYDYNLELSKARADSVRDCCINAIGLTAAGKAMMSDLLVAKGCASDRPILKDDGSVDSDASRRVSLRFTVNVD